MRYKLAMDKDPESNITRTRALEIVGIDALSNYEKDIEATNKKDPLCIRREFYVGALGRNTLIIELEPQERAKEQAE